MENLLNQKDCAAIIERCNNISPVSERQWGKMEVHHMIVHLKDQLDISLGNKPASAQGPVIFRTWLGRLLALYILPWGKGKIATPIEMDALKKGIIITDFESDKHLLLMRIKEFVAATDYAPHPFFGKMNKKDWGRLVWKHFNHHLLQFGT